MIKKIAMVSFVLLGMKAASQSPWVNEKGSFYGQFSTTYLSYNRIVSDDLNEIIDADFRTTDITASFYADYSISNKLALIVVLPYKAVKANGGSLSSLGDPSIKLKYQLLKEIPISGYLGYTAPLSKREGILRTGYNQHAVDLGLSIGKGKEKSFIYGGLSYRYRANISDQALLEFEYGYRFVVAKKPLYMILRVDGVFNTSSSEDPEAGQAVLFHNDGEFLSPALKFSYNIFDEFWINTGFHSAVLVRNLGASPTLNLGVAYKVSK